MKILNSERRVLKVERLECDLEFIRREVELLASETYEDLI